MKNIIEEDITFVIQGAVNREDTQKTISSIKKFFPKSYIILSTWEGSNVSDFEVNEVILNKDPNGFKYFFNSEVSNNVNRQITSTINGLKKVKTKYAFKIRTDFILTGNSFLKYFDEFEKYNNDYKIFKHKVITSTFITRNPKCKKFPYPFHVSDFCFFGLTEDLIDLFDIPLVDKEEQNYFLEHKGIKNPNNFICRYAAEQTIMINWLKKYKNIDCKYYNDNSEKNIKLTEQFIVNNFILLNWKQFDINTLKFYLTKLKSRLEANICYTYLDYTKLYKKLCDNEYKTKFIDTEFLEILISKVRRFLLKPIANLICMFIKNKDLKAKIRLKLY